MKQTKQAEAQTIEAQFDDFAADVMLYHPLFLQHLFGCTPGMWVYVDELCDGDSALIERVDALQDASDSELLAMWVDYSDIVDQDNFVSVVFHAEGHGWSTVAVYNRGLLKQS
jgi:hypothetical protein